MIWLLANWRVVALAALVAVPSLYAAVAKHQRDAARATIAQMQVEARLQAERAKAEIERQKTITKGVDDEHRKRQSRLNADNARLRDELQQYASRSLVPSVPDPATGDDEPLACFDRGLLNAELTGVLQRYGARLSAIAGEGESVSAAFAACSGWAIGESKKQQ